VSKEEKAEVKPTAAQKLQEFVEKENILLVPQPSFRARDDGTFSVVVALSVDYKDAPVNN